MSPDGDIAVEPLAYFDNYVRLGYIALVGEESPHIFLSSKNP